MDRPHEIMLARDDARRLSRPVACTVAGPRLLRPLLRWMARRRWIHAEVERVECTRVYVPAGGGLVDRLHLGARDMELISCQEARYLFVGPDVMGEAHDELRRARVMSLGAVEFRHEDDRGKMTMLGVELVLVPWMSGCLLVPEWRK